MKLIRLSVPFNPGDVDPGITYEYARVVEIEFNAEEVAIHPMTLRVRFGNAANGVWQPGKVSNNMIMLTRPELVALAERQTEDGWPVIEALENAILDWLLYTSRYVGNIVDA
jgi:hypothetical protein